MSPSNVLRNGTPVQKVLMIGALLIGLIIMNVEAEKVCFKNNATMQAEYAATHHHG